MKKTFLLPTFLMLSTPALAESDPLQACLDKAGASTDGIIELCSEKASETYKKQITKSYNAIFAHYQKTEPEKAKSFEEAQKAWLVNRNKNCDISDSKQKCLMNSNKQRAEELSEREKTLAPVESVQKPPLLSPKKDIMFDKKENVKWVMDGEKQSAELTYYFQTLKTGLDWLDNLLLQQFSPDDKNVTREKIISALTKSYNEQKTEMKESYSSSSFWVKQSISFVGQKSNLATFISNDQGYYGGNYEVDQDKYLYIDLVNKRLFELNDIFTKQGLEEVKKLLWETYQQMDYKFEDIKKSDFPVSNIFQIHGSIITFYYRKSSIAISAYGPQELSISIDGLKTFIKSEARQLFE
ncbi:lysozyme inhibitor LprI family protein [Ursidibacter arcticus]